MEITRDVLIQYSEIKQEVKDLRKRIDGDERTLKKIQESGYVVSDFVKGTKKDGRIGHIKITGVPFPEYDRVKNLLNRRITKLILLEEDLLETMNAVDEYIDSIDRSEIRIMFRLYYLDDLTWPRVAMQMNSLFPKNRNVYTDESCRKKHDRYLTKIQREK